MLIVSQDRDTTVKFDFNNSTLTTIPVFHQGVCFGNNLYVNQTMIGTFDDLEMVNMEYTNILSCPYHEYHVSGYAFLWQDWNTLCEIMKGGE